MTRVPADESAGWIGNWAPGIGDPSFAGWATVVLYAVAVFLGYRVTRLSIPRRERLAWWIITVLFLMLGINKQLDLQSALTEYGRIVARSQHWYRQRQIVQVLFILGVAISGLFGARFLLGLTRGAHRATRLAIVGTLAVLAFVVIRAASFHHIDQLIHVRLGGPKLNWILEMGGISVVIVAAWMRGKRTKR